MGRQGRQEENREGMFFSAFLGGLGGSSISPR
jgi:hypothetical protein